MAAGYPTAVKVDTRGDLSAAFWNDQSTFAGDRFHASSYGHEHFAHHISEAVEEALRFPASSGSLEAGAARPRR